MNTVTDMHRYMIEYFSAEKSESALFILIGAAAIVLSVIVYLRVPAYRGMIIPLVSIAIIQIAVGGSVFFRTDTQVRRLDIRLVNDSASYKAVETHRMNAVMRNFKIYKIIEISLLLVGIALTFIFAKKDFIYALGIGLIAQAALMLVLDLLAEKRAMEYIDHIRSLLL